MTQTDSTIKRDALTASRDPEKYFWGKASTIEAIRQCGAANAITIYCGAGVTLDRTGLSWQGLVSQVFASTQITAAVNAPDSGAMRRLLASDVSEAAKASAISCYVSERIGNDHLIRPAIEHRTVLRSVSIVC